MTIQHFSRLTFLFLLIGMSSPVSASFSIHPPIGSNTPPTDSSRATVLVQRLEEISNLPKEGMTRMEKRQLRRETKDIRKEMKVISGGVYISVGAIIIIILLLILIL